MNMRHLWEHHQRHQRRFFEDGEPSACHDARHGRTGAFAMGADEGGGRGFRGSRRSGPFGGRHGDRAGGGFGGGRVFGHGDLKLVLLALIAEQPRHGYELIRTIEEMFDGAYAPSPGAVYPTLTMLEEMGYASVEMIDGGKKCYTITAAGHDFLEDNRIAVDAVMQRMADAAKMYSRMAAPMAIREAMHTLKHALRARVAPWTTAEAKRVLAIIKRAADEIVSGNQTD
ncbi:MAG: PadR family transcriptional regulator [Xanthomonadales bacterium]|nr:PadR family transcriptional regulator [Xanthomonadales bacterium]